MHAYAGMENNIAYPDATKALQRMETKELNHVQKTCFTMALMIFSIVSPAALV